jgi:hypothetical protein
MPFDPLCRLDLTEEWQTTPPTQGNYFRFGYSNNSGFSYLVVAQAQVGDGSSLELFGAFRFNLKGQGADIAELDIPAVFVPEYRRLAVRGLGSRNQPGKTLSLSIGETFMIPVNPSAAATQQVRSTLSQATAGAVEVLPASSIRSGGAIFNTGTSALAYAFGSEPDVNGEFVLAPGGRVDIDPSFKGFVKCQWKTVDGAPNTTKKAAIYEFV